MARFVNTSEAYNAYVLKQPPTRLQREVLNVLWAANGQPLLTKEIAKAAFPNHRQKVFMTVEALKSLPSALQPAWKLASRLEGGVNKSHWLMAVEEAQPIEDSLSLRRRQIYVLVRDNPGITSRQLSNQLNIKDNVLREAVYQLNDCLRPVGQRISGYPMGSGYSLKAASLRGQNRASE